MAKTVAIVIARMGSTRFPGKVLADLAGSPVLDWVVRAAEDAPGVDEAWVATSTLPADDQIEKWCKDNFINCFRGSESDVLSRFLWAAEEAHADVAIRITGDCPFVDPKVIGEVVALREATDADYCSNIDPPTYPDGLDCEAIKIEALRAAAREATSRIDRDCVTQYIASNRDRFKSETVICPIPGLHKERWVLDTQNDYRLCQEIAEKAYIGDSYLGILKFLNENPHLRDINKHHPRNERFYEALGTEELAPRSYQRSKEQLVAARAVIPLGAQTFSKSYVQFPEEHPLFLTHGDGAYAFDVDGNRYVDLVGCLLANILGYRDPDVDHAIRRQINSGISFSLATTLEEQLAERIVRLVPCADMVRFGKNGTDVTTAAIRLCRAITGRDHILTSGYHGWSDVFVGADGLRSLGVPRAVGALTKNLNYSDRPGFYASIISGRYACVIVEPETNPLFLQDLRQWCSNSDTLLVFDEIITWPRWGLHGAQGRFKVTPDLATIGKAMGNGMPISALVGKREYMKRLEPPNSIFYSGTFQGETLSLAAALACLDKLERENVVEKLDRTNTALNQWLTDALRTYRSPIVMQDTAGLTRLAFQGVSAASPAQVAAVFRREMAANGVLIINSNNLTYAHGPDEMKRVRTAYEKTLQALNQTDWSAQTDAVAGSVR